jgi:adenine-specific DNA-methyltransferase
MYFPIYVRRSDAAIRLDKPEESGWEIVYPRKSDGSDGRWGWGKKKVQDDGKLLVARLIESRNEFDIFVKDYLQREGEERTRKFKTLWDGTNVNNQVGTQEVKALFGAEVMSYPKSTGLLCDAVRLGCPDDGIVMDFFAGSATTAHSVMLVNAEDGKPRRHILVQLAEACQTDSPAFKAGYNTIAEVAKERIRRAGKLVKENAGLSGGKLDTGFRVLKVDTSNMKDVYYQPDAVTQETLRGLVNNVKDDRSDEDLLFQILLDWGVDLTLPIKPEKIKGKTVHFVDTNALAACFEPGIDEEFIKELAKRKPLRVVFRDTGYGNDATKINVEQIFKLVSPGTEVKSI